MCVLSCAERPVFLYSQLPVFPSSMFTWPFSFRPCVVKSLYSQGYVLYVPNIFRAHATIFQLNMILVPCFPKVLIVQVKNS